MYIAHLYPQGLVAMITGIHGCVACDRGLSKGLAVAHKMLRAVGTYCFNTFICSVICSALSMPMRYVEGSLVQSVWQGRVQHPGWSGTMRLVDCVQAVKELLE